MNGKEIRAALKTQRVFIEFKANDGRLLIGEVMRQDGPPGHFAVTVNWATWYVTPDVMLRFVPAQEVFMKGGKKSGKHA